MLKRFETSKVLSALNYVSQTERRFRSDLELLRQPGATMNMEAAGERRTLLLKFSILRKVAEEYELQALPSALDEAEAFFGRDDLPWKMVDLQGLTFAVNHLVIVNAAATHSLIGSSIYHLSRGAADFVSGKSTSFGADVENAFPRSVQDISEASKCRGLERWTASVMHCMRALEPALLALANHVLGHAPKKENWHDVLKEIEDEIDKRKKAGKHKALQFESEAAGYFRDIKDGWRNHTMHAKTMFGEDEAVAAYDATRSLMRHLSKRFSEGP